MLCNVLLQDFCEHMKKLRELVAHKQTCFEYLQGYAWAIEHGRDRGFHCHLLLIYDGAKRQSDYYLGLCVGNKWVEVTQGKGDYYNCNNTEYKAYWANLKKLGIGMIHRDDMVKRQNAIKVAQYLTDPFKHEQMLSIKLPNMRTFGRGQFNTPHRRGIKVHS